MLASSRVKFASQTYSWQMSGNWFGKLEEIVKSVRTSGFGGIEPEVCMTGGFESPQLLENLLLRNSVNLAALTLVLDWRHPVETPEERHEADRVIKVLRKFPETKLVLVQMPSHAWTDRNIAQDNLLKCLDSITHRASEFNIQVTYHPNSPTESIVRTSEDYEKILTRLPQNLGWTPDTGHLFVGGMDPVEMIRNYRELVDHIHLKDADLSGSWVPNGKGCIDLIGSVAELAKTNYSGWVVLEDESPQAEDNPMGAAHANGKYFRENLSPLFSGVNK